jgi:hypothetical protein
MSIRIAVVLLLGIVGCEPASDETIHDSRVWNNSLDGSWLVVAVEHDGALKNPGEYAIKGLDISRTKIRADIWDNGYYSGSYKSLEGQFDYSGFHLVDTPGGTVALLDDFLIWKGIYTIEEETLKICFVQQTDADLLPKERPSEFRTNKGDRRVLLTLKRKTP